MAPALDASLDRAMGLLDEAGVDASTGDGADARAEAAMDVARDAALVEAGVDAAREAALDAVMDVVPPDAAGTSRAS